jgi:hypothetical protein
MLLSTDKQPLFIIVFYFKQLNDMRVDETQINAQILIHKMNAYKAINVSRASQPQPVKNRAKRHDIRTQRINARS